YTGTPAGGAGVGRHVRRAQAPTGFSSLGLAGGGLLLYSFRVRACGRIPVPAGRRELAPIDSTSKPMMLKTPRTLALLGFALPFVGCASSGPAALAPADAGMVEWTAYNGEQGMRFSPLSQIDRSNVADLQIAWEWDSTPVLGEDTEFRNQSTPLMVDGVLYFTAGTERQVIAADARTGETLWVYRFEDPRNEIAPRANSGRGVSYWTDGQDERIFVVTPGFWLVALDPETGTPVAS